MPFRYAYLLPIIGSVWFILTFIIMYIIAVVRKDVPLVFPYISDTGSWSPESCIFGLMLCIGAAIMFSVCYIRYRQIKELSRKHTFKPIVKKLNNIFFYLNFQIALGIILVGNFQETNAFAVHIIGANLCFGGTCLGLNIQTWIGFSIYPKVGDRRINIVRAALILVVNVSCVLTGVFCVLSYIEFKGEDFTKWTKEDGGWIFHLISSVTEWILAITTMLYIATLTKDFKDLTLHEPPISLA